MDLDIDWEPETVSKQEYIQTDAGNRVSRKSLVLGSQNIVVGGKTIIQAGALIHGDLRKLAGVSQNQAALINIGKHGLIGKMVVIRPPCKSYKGAFNYYPVRIGDNVLLGAGSIIEAASIGNNVVIGKNCIVGKFTILKDNCYLLPNSTLPAQTVVPPNSIYGGNPAQFIREVPECWAEVHEERVREMYEVFRVR